jgi:hypothetical protein
MVDVVATSMHMLVCNGQQWAGCKVLFFAWYPSNSNGFAFFVWQKMEFANSQINMGKIKKRLSPTVWQN